MKIDRVLISKKLHDYLTRRGLWRQFEKAKQYLLDWKTQNVRLKIREPKSKWIYYFRINQQYRARGVMENNSFKIFHIDDHQN